MNNSREMLLRFFTVAALVLTTLSCCAAFSQRSSTFLGRRQASSVAASRRARTTMKDSSASYWFSLGDQVRVVDDVVKAGINLKGRSGTVVETWEKCDVDPTCCCAEQVDIGMAVRVEFQGTEKDVNGGPSFYHYFAEDELLKEPKRQQQAFDGMSCTAFKLEQLQLDDRPRKLASFEPVASTTDDDKSAS